LYRNFKFGGNVPTAHFWQQGQSLRS